MTSVAFIQNRINKNQHGGKESKVLDKKSAFEMNQKFLKFGVSFKKDIHKGFCLLHGFYFFYILLWSPVEALLRDTVLDNMKSYWWSGKNRFILSIALFTIKYYILFDLGI